MTPEDFAEAMHTTVFMSAVEGVVGHLRNGAPGRGPHLRSDAMTSWFNDLSLADQAMVSEVTRTAAHAGIFGVLCVLDGVRAIDEPPHASLVLTATDAVGGESVLASPDCATQLHDEFNARVHPPSETWPPPTL